MGSPTNKRNKSVGNYTFIYKVDFKNIQQVTRKQAPHEFSHARGSLPTDAQIYMCYLQFWQENHSGKCTQRDINIAAFLPFLEKGKEICKLDQGISLYDIKRWCCHTMVKLHAFP